MPLGVLLPTIWTIAQLCGIGDLERTVNQLIFNFELIDSLLLRSSTTY
jgi:hypothetical protein